MTTTKIIEAIVYAKLAEQLQKQAGDMDPSVVPAPLGVQAPSMPTLGQAGMGPPSVAPSSPPGGSPTGPAQAASGGMENILGAKLEHADPKASQRPPILDGGNIIGAPTSVAPSSPPGGSPPAPAFNPEAATQAEEKSPYDPNYVDNNSKQPISKQPISDHPDISGAGARAWGGNGSANQQRSTTPTNTAPTNTAPTNTAPNNTKFPTTLPTNTAPTNTAPNNTKFPSATPPQQHIALQPPGISPVSNSLSQAVNVQGMNAPKAPAFSPAAATQAEKSDMPTPAESAAQGEHRFDPAQAKTVPQRDAMAAFQRSTGSKFDPNSAMDRANLARIQGGQGTFNRAQYRQSLRR